VIAEGELGYVWLTHEFRAGLDTLEEHLIELLTSWIRTIIANYHFRLDERARGSAKIAQ
jgi:hypothetical protein